MLRVIHTADWHLGQSFHGFDRDFEHGRFLRWLAGVIGERRPDVLLVAGDVFDTVNPSAASQRLFYDFLSEAHAAHPALQMVVVAGNHDAAGRLEAPAALFRKWNVSVVGTVARDAAGVIDLRRFLVPLRDAAGVVRGIAVAVPYLRPPDVPELPESADPYLEGIRALYHTATEAARALRDAEFPGAVLIGMGHCHMLSASESRDSERRIIIGTAEAVRVDTFPADLAYVALGHLHKQQALDGGRIRYSGSPLPLSFSECDYAHAVFELGFEGAVLESVEAIPVARTAALLRVPEKPEPMERALEAIAAMPLDATLPPKEHPFLEVRVLDDGPDPTRQHRIVKALEGRPVRLASFKLVAAEAEAAGAAKDAPLAGLDDLTALDPEEIMISAHRERFATEPDAELLAALREILAEEVHAGAEGVAVP